MTAPPTGDLVAARPLTRADTVRALALTLPVLALAPAIFAAVAGGAPAWAVAPLVLLQVHFMHAGLICFHEAAHHNFARSRWYNEAYGLLIGTLSFMSLSLYRAAHHTHHAHFGTERDEELWPHTHVTATRRLRLLVAAFELGLGLVATPVLFLRSFLRPGTPVRDPRVRRRVWLELGLIAVAWGGAVAAVTAFGVWVPFLVAVVLPAALTGNLTMWRKYVEHVGLTGDGPTGLTRTVVARGWVGRVLAALLFHEPYHGVHHLYAGLPSGRLPRFAGALPSTDPDDADRRLVFPSYRAALWDLVRGLGDPRVGPQWRAREAAPTAGLTTGWDRPP